jgi:hypothetical protein
MGLLVVATGALLGIDTLRDNSFLTHLATGRLILDTGGIPHADPYSFTAPGHEWFVQSWLVSVGYAWTEALWGLDGVRVLCGALSAALTGLAWMITRPATGLVARLGLAALFVLVGSGLWAERPLMVGLIALALTILVVERVIPPPWLVPIGWIWVNSHGSFPLGLVFIATVVAGSRLDGADWRDDLRCLWWALGGVLLGVLGPLGLGALSFPVQLLSRQDVLSHVVEWRAPTFDSLSQRAFLLQLLVAVVLLARRPSYRAALPMVVFVAAAMLGMRNITVASLVLLPAMARGVADVGTLGAGARVRRGGVAVLALAALSVVLVVSRLQESDIRLDAYPIRALAYLEGQGIDTRVERMATPEMVGNVLTYIYGPQRRVFYDDRFDMYPAKVTRVALDLEEAAPGVMSGLTEMGIDLVLVERDAPVALALVADASWRVLLADDHWTLSCRRGAELGGQAGVC